MKITLAAITVGLSLLLGTIRLNAATVTLYDSSKNSLPDQQGQLSLTKIGTASETLGSGYTILNTTPNNETDAGYSPSASLTLDRSLGFTISFDLQVVSEEHTGSDKNGDGIDDRAGFSVIALSSDKKGVELAFWTDMIWTQSDNPLFTHQPSESKSYNTTANPIHYELLISGDNYMLYANNAILLSHSLHDYTAFKGLINPYSTPNFLFLGDDTTSAQANVNLGSISVTTNISAVPYEFSPTWGILTLAAWGAVAQLKNKKQ